MKKVILFLVSAAALVNAVLCLATNSISSVYYGHNTAFSQWLAIHLLDNPNPPFLAVALMILTFAALIYSVLTFITAVFSRKRAVKNKKLRHTAISSFFTVTLYFFSVIALIANDIERFNGVPGSSALLAEPMTDKTIFLDLLTGSGAIPSLIIGFTLLAVHLVASKILND